MFLKVFLVSSCLVLYATSKPTRGIRNCRRDIGQLKDLWVPSMMNCSSQFVQEIDLTRPNNLRETIQETLCEIREVLNECMCTGARVREVQNLLDGMKGSATCQLLGNGKLDSTGTFLSKVRGYITSFHDVSCN